MMIMMYRVVRLLFFNPAFFFVFSSWRRLDSVKMHSFFFWTPWLQSLNSAKKEEFYYSILFMDGWHRTY